MCGTGAGMLLCSAVLRVQYAMCSTDTVAVACTCPWGIYARYIDLNPLTEDCLKDGYCDERVVWIRVDVPGTTRILPAYARAMRCAVLT
eukprot:3747133-Rhodomonas_salina.10